MTRGAAAAPVSAVTAWAERPLGRRGVIVVVAAALALLAVTFGRATRPASAIAGSDVTAYAVYGTRMLDGEMPYRDFDMEYPPGATPMFVLPATRLVARGSTEGIAWSPVDSAARRYYRGFTTLVLVLVGTMVALTGVTLAAMRRPAWTVLLAVAVVALSPVLIGQVLTERFDVLPAALTAAALAAGVRGRFVLGGAMLGLGAAAKLYPVLLVPALAIVAARDRGARSAVAVVAAAGGAALAVLAPFAIASPSGTWDALQIQFRGGLQIETLASSILVLTGHAAEHLSALGIPRPAPLTTQGAGGGLTRIDLAGSGVAETKTVMNLLLAAALCGLWWRLARSTAEPREDLLRYAAATVTCVLVLGTVLSPQYVTWLIPLAPLVGGRRGAVATLLVVTAAVLTNVWIPDRYFDYQDGLDAGPASLLFARNLALVAAAVVLLLPARVATRTTPSWSSQPGAAA